MCVYVCMYNMCVYTYAYLCVFMCVYIYMFVERGHREEVKCLWQLLIPGSIVFINGEQLASLQTLPFSILNDIALEESFHSARHQPRKPGGQFPSMGTRRIYF